MKKLLFLFVCALAFHSLHGQVIFKENFENGAGIFEGVKIDTMNPGEGKACALIQSPTPETESVALVSGTTLLPVKPDTWYRFSFLFRNNIGNGELKYGFQESTSATEMKSQWYSWQWHALPLNIDSWNRYTGEFKTATGTQAIKLYFRTENNLSGFSWLDDFSIEEFVPIVPPLTIKPYDAVATYTDIPTLQAYTNPATHDGNFQPLQAEYLWRTMDLGKRPLTVKYHDLPEGTSVTAEVVRGKQTLFSEKRQLAGSGEVEFDIGIGKLPEGIYVFRVSSVTDGKTTCTQQKELWRIRQADINMPQLEPIQTVGIGSNRHLLVNGKPFRAVETCAFPCSGLLFHKNKNCKPDHATYLKYAQQQFGFNVAGVWDWRGNKWDGKLDEYDAMASNRMKEWLDVLKENNYYGTVVFDESTERGRRLPRPEWIKSIAESVRNHPAFLLYTLDEPEIPKYPPEQMIDRYKLLKSLDPNHLVHVNLCDPAKFKDYAPCSDLATLDVYPFPGMSLKENEKRMKKLLDAFPKTAPMFEYLQMFNFRDLPMPSFDQVFGEFVLDRIFGSRELVSYAWGESRQSFLTDMELQAYFRAIYATFMKIEDAFDAGTRIEWPITSSTPDVRTCAIRKDDETIVLAVNLSKETTAAISFKTSAKSVTSFMDDAWSYPLDNGTFRWQMAPNDALILRLK
ncbi:MAG: hypothetical protein J6X55_11340 [Victivallales bacterium]|nr:hypothetical protein [Victivallales bacterium]